MTARDAEAQLGERVAVYLDAGPVPLGVASTIVDVTGAVPRIVRTGALSAEALRRVVPDIADPAAPAR